MGDLHAFIPQSNFQKKYVEFSLLRTGLVALKPVKFMIMWAVSNYIKYERIEIRFELQVKLLKSI